MGFRTPDTDALLERAVSAAAEAYVAIVCVGTTQETESEGHDRAAFALRGRQDELIRRVAAVNDHTVVVVNAGSPVDMAWADDVAAVLQSWFGGQEMGAAVADVLAGHAEPGCGADHHPDAPRAQPFAREFPGENGELRYGEGLFMDTAASSTALSCRCFRSGTA